MKYYYLLYIILFLADSFFGQFYKEDKDKQKKAFTLTAFLLVFLLFALRHPSMGVDLGYFGHKMGYLQSFDILNTYSWNEILKLESWLNYERGYIVFNKLVGSLYNNRQFFLGVCAFISLFPIFLYIRKKSTLPFLSVVILMGLPIFLVQLSGLRQVIAIAITIFSMSFIEEKRKIPFILTVLFATLFHKSAIIFLVAYPMFYIRLNDIWKAVFTLFIPFVFLFRKPLFETLSKMFKEDAAIQDTGALTLFLVFTAVYIYLIILNKECDKNQNGMINLFYLACLCQAFGGIYNIAMRVGYYFMPYLMIAIPNTITKNKDKQEYQTNYVLVLLAFVAYGLYAIKTSTWEMAYPYYFFWE